MTKRDETMSMAAGDGHTDSNTTRQDAPQWDSTPTTPPSIWYN